MSSMVDLKRRIEKLESKETKKFKGYDVVTFEEWENLNEEEKKKSIHSKLCLRFLLLHYAERYPFLPKEWESVFIQYLDEIKDPLHLKLEKYNKGEIETLT